MFNGHKHKETEPRHDASTQTTHGRPKLRMQVCLDCYFINVFKINHPLKTFCNCTLIRVIRSLVAFEERSVNPSGNWSKQHKSRMMTR